MVRAMAGMVGMVGVVGMVGGAGRATQGGGVCDFARFLSLPLLVELTSAAGRGSSIESVFRFKKPVICHKTSI